jgi:hypothetical protein
MSPIDIHPRRQASTSVGRTPEEIVTQQKADATRQRQQQAGRPSRRANTPPAASPANVPARVQATVPAAAAADTRTPQQAYLDEVAPSAIAGRLVKFNGIDGRFVTADDDEPLGDDVDFFALCPEVQVGWVKFSQEDGMPPDRRMGLLYDSAFTMLPRAALGDLDPAEWPQGLSGGPEDPWLHQMNLPIQATGTREIFTFSTTSKTGRRATGNLLRHYDRLQRTSPGDVPIIRLRAGGFNHKDDRIGWVATPVLSVVGRAPRDDAAKPEIPPPDTSLGGAIGDSIPF